MATYRFKENSDNKKNVEITKGVFRFSPLAVVVCLLIAFLFWLYAVNISSEGESSENELFFNGGVEQMVDGEQLFDGAVDRNY